MEDDLNVKFILEMFGFEKLEINKKKYLIDKNGYIYDWNIFMNNNSQLPPPAGIKIDGIVYSYIYNDIGVPQSSSVYDIDLDYIKMHSKSSFLKLDINIRDNIDYIGKIPVTSIDSNFIKKLYEESKKGLTNTTIKIPDGIKKVILDLDLIKQLVCEKPPYSNPLMRNEMATYKIFEEDVLNYIYFLLNMNNDSKTTYNYKSNEFFQVEEQSTNYGFIINKNQDSSKINNSIIGTYNSKSKEYSLNIGQDITKEEETFNKIIKKIYPKVDDLIKCENFYELKSNFTSLVSHGISLNVIETYPEMINYSYDKIIENISENYNNLTKQLSNRISPKTLQLILFDFEFNDEDIKEQLSKNINAKLENKIYPILKLMKEPTPELKQQLNDELEFISNNFALNVKELERYVKIQARQYFGRTIFENIVEMDKEKYKEITHLYPKKISSSNVDDYLEGIHTILEREIKKINPKILNYCLDLSEKEQQELIKSLTTVKNWELLSNDKKKRATRLKNEILGKLLYSIYKVEIKENNKTLDQVDLQSIVPDEEFKTKILNTFKNISFNDITSNINNQNSANLDISIIEKIIKINPYFYDMILDTPLQENKKLKSTAENNLYLFFDENGQENYSNIILEEYTMFIIQKILNDIESGLFTDSENYLNSVRNQVDIYFENKDTSEENLFNIFRSIEVFLRNNNSVMERNSRKLNLDPETVLNFNIDLFDKTNPEYNNYDRMCYMLRMINLLAHDEEEFQIKKFEVDFNRYKNNSNINADKLKEVLQAYGNVYNYGLTPEIINNILKSPNLYKKLKKEVSDKLELDESQRNKEKLNLLETKVISLKEQLHTLNNSEINTDNVEEIIRNVDIILNADENIRKEMEKEVKAQRLFYDTKKLIAEKLVRIIHKNLNTITDDIIDDKVKFFKENGYILEYQKDVQSKRGDDIVVVYNPKFNNAFSIHMNKVEPDIKKIFEKLAQNMTANGKEPKLAHAGTKVIYAREKISELELKEISYGYYDYKKRKGTKVNSNNKKRYLFQYSGQRDDSNSILVDYATRSDIKFHNFVEYDLETMKLYYESIDKNNSNDLIEFANMLKAKVGEILENPTKTTYEINGTKYNLYTFICNRIDNNNRRLFDLLSAPYIKILSNQNAPQQVITNSTNITPTSTVTKNVQNQHFTSNDYSQQKDEIPKTTRQINTKKGKIIQYVQNFKENFSNNKYKLKKRITSSLLKKSESLTEMLRNYIEQNNQDQDEKKK